MISTPSFLEITIYYLILYCVFEYKRTNNSEKELEKYNKVLKCTTLLVILNILISVLPQNNLILCWIDVGQGDSMLIKTIHKKTILIDGGGSENSEYDVGEKILVPYLLDNTNGTIDYMIISHFHEDHAEGCLSVLKKIKVKNILIGVQPKMTKLYEEVLKIAKEKEIPIITLVQGDILKIDGLVLEVLFPNKTLEFIDDLNNNSLVMKITYGKNSLLLTGDIEEDTEKKLLEENISKKLDTTILKVAHHGSKTSSSYTFLEKVTPKIALIGVGEENKFNHPNQEILERLTRCNSVIYRTDEMGEIRLKIKKNGIVKIKTKI